MKKQTKLSEKPENKDWKDMPEFEQEKQDDCFSKITVRFETEQDLQDFAKLIGQKLTKKTRSIWHPAKSHWNSELWRWIDES